MLRQYDFLVFLPRLIHQRYHLQYHHVESRVYDQLDQYVTVFHKYDNHFASLFRPVNSDRVFRLILVQLELGDRCQEIQHILEVFFR